MWIKRDFKTLHQARMWQVAAALGRQTSLTFYNTATQMNWGGISFARKRERILNAISRDIWAPAVLIKGFHRLFCFWVDFWKQCSHRRNRKARKGHRSIRGLYAFNSLVAAADAFELLIEQKKTHDAETNKQPTMMRVSVVFYLELIAGAWSTPFQLYEQICGVCIP